MPNEYCRFLSNAVRLIGSNPSYQPCCWIKSSEPIESREHLDRIRKDYTKKILNDKEKFCNNCITREQSGFNISHRQKSFQLIPEDAVDGDITHLVFQVDTTCNAACVICGPHFSSLWQKEINPLIKLKDFTETHNKLLDILDLSKLKTIQFLGGEPFANSQHLKILSAIPNLENVIVMYNTNGSVFPDTNVLKLWKKTKYVHLTFSVDGIEDQFNYLRWPLSWTKVKNNIINMANIDSVQFINLNVTINPMNILSFGRLEEWYSKLIRTSYKFKPISCSLCYGIWGTDVTPTQVRKQALENYGPGHPISRILEVTGDTNKNKWLTLVKNMEQLDTKRKLSWKNTFPEIVDLTENLDDQTNTNTSIEIK